MQADHIDILTAPKYKIRQIPIESAIRSVQKFKGQNLKAVYAKICGEDALLKLQNNTAMLRRRICWELQKQRHGGLSVRHYNMIYRLTSEPVLPAIRDGYQPKPGTLLTRVWKGKKHEIHVRGSGFEYEGEIYASLSRIAKIITGHERSGPVFFGLKKQKGQAA